MIRALVPFALSVVVWLVSAGCGSSTDSRGAAATTSVSTHGTTAPRSDRVVHVNKARLVVAGQRAVVADGAMPTELQIADLSSDDPEKLRPLTPPHPLEVRGMATVGTHVVIVGNRCDGGAVDDGIAYQCRPGTPVLSVLDPGSTTWTDVDLDPGWVTFDDVHVVPATGPTTTVSVFVRTRRHMDGERRLFTVDTDEAKFTPQALPDGYVTTLQGEEYQCFGTDGHQTVMLTSSSEAVEGVAPSRIWWRSSPEADWQDVALPSSSRYPVAPSRCDHGDLVVGVPGDGDHQHALAQVRYFTYQPTEGTWRDATAPPDDHMPRGAVAAGWVQEPAGDRRWIDGQIWRVDDRGTYVNTDVPDPPLGYVRASVPWRDAKMVALVDVASDPNDTDLPMKLRLVIVAAAPDGS